MKNENNKKHSNIYKIESIKKHSVNYFIRKLRLGEKKQI